MASSRTGPNGGCEHVIGRIEGSDASLAPVLILGHLDTVHPVGTFQPVFEVTGGVARGPGGYDDRGAMT